MLDYPRIVEEIQSALASAQIDWDLLRDSAAEYAAACDEVNVRLAECQRLLKSGLRSEALQLSEREPNLLDAVGLLDFPELSQWQQLLGANGMVLPPVLRLDYAADLNTAYAEEAPLQSLLKAHRLLALTRAPLPRRIQVLRAIRQADSANPMWTEDLEKFERHRQQQMVREAEQAHAALDAPVLSGLVQELESSGWLHAPTPQMLQQVRWMQQRVVAHHARQELQAVVEQFREAYEAYDVDQARLVRQQWRTLYPIALLSSNDPLVQEAQVALDWLDQQDASEARQAEHDKALRALEHALNRDTPRPELERLMLALERYDEEIPERFLVRYGERMRSFETAGRRRFTVLISSVVGVLALCAAVTAWLIVRHQHESHVHAAARALAEFVEKNKVAEGLRFLEGLEPDIAARPEIKQSAARLAEMAQHDETRARRFAVLMDLVEGAGESGKASTELLEAKSLAVTLEERSRLADWTRKVAAHEQQLRLAREREFVRGIEELVPKLQELEADLGAKDFDVRYLAARSHAQELAAHRAILSQELGAQLNPVLGRLEAIGRLRDGQRNQENHLNRLIASVGKPDAYRAELLAFANAFPDAALSDDFKRVANEAELWTQALAWRDAYRQSAFQELNKLTPAAARRLMETMQPLVEKYGASPCAESWKLCKEQVDAIAAREDASGKPTTADLRRLFQDPLLRSVLCVKTSDGKRYYAKAVPTKKGTSDALKYSLKYLKGFDFSEGTVDLPADRIVAQGPAAQQALGKELVGWLDVADEGKWESGFYSMIKLLLDDTSEVDPVLRAVLLKRTLEAAQKGSYGLRVACAELRSKLDDKRELLSTNWLDPENSAADSARTTLQTLLSDAGSPDAIGQRARDANRELTAAPTEQPEWLGTLVRRGKSWEARGSFGQRTGALLVLEGDGGAVRWRRVADLSSGEVDWTAEDDKLLASGRALFYQSGSEPVAQRDSRK
jgi:hypothetical protein